MRAPTNDQGDVCMREPTGDQGEVLVQVPAVIRERCVGGACW